MDQLTFKGQSPFFCTRDIICFIVLQEWTPTASVPKPSFNKFTRVTILIVSVSKVDNLDHVLMHGKARDFKLHMTKTILFLILQVCSVFYVLRFSVPSIILVKARLMQITM